MPCRLGVLEHLRREVEGVRDRDVGDSAGIADDGLKLRHDEGAVGRQLQEVDPGVYEMFCLPLRVVGSDGAPARVVLRRS